MRTTCKATVAATQQAPNSNYKKPRFRGLLTIKNPGRIFNPAANSISMKRIPLGALYI